MIELPDTSTEARQREASVMLARLRGWRMEETQWGDGFVLTDGQEETIDGELYTDGQMVNLYDPANMALAWRVLNWAFNNLPGDTGQSQNFFDFLNAREYWEQEFLWSMPPAAAQRAWLDKILQLAIEAGMCGREGGAWYIDLRLLRQKEE